MKGIKKSGPVKLWGNRLMITMIIIVAHSTKERLVRRYANFLASISLQWKKVLVEIVS